MSKKDAQNAFAIGAAAKGMVGVKSGGTKVQSDYNENDINAPSYIRNRPFYEEVSGKEAVVVNKQSFNVEALPDGTHSGDLGIFIETVNWEDGDKGAIEIVSQNSGDIIKKEMKLGKIPLGAGVIYFVGNIDLQMPDYAYLTQANDTTVDWLFFTGNFGSDSSSSLKMPQDGKYDVSIKTLGNTVIHKLDKKYFPELNEIVLNSSTSESTKTFKITVDDTGTLKATEII